MYIICLKVKQVQEMFLEKIQIRLLDMKIPVSEMKNIRHGINGKSEIAGVRVGLGVRVGGAVHVRQSNTK